MKTKIEKRVRSFKTVYEYETLRPLFEYHTVSPFTLSYERPKHLHLEFTFTVKIKEK